MNDKMKIKLLLYLSLFLSLLSYTHNLSSVVHWIGEKVEMTQAFQENINQMKDLYLAVVVDLI